MWGDCRKVSVPNPRKHTEEELIQIETASKVSPPTKYYRWKDKADEEKIRTVKRNCQRSSTWDFRVVASAAHLHALSFCTRLTDLKFSYCKISGTTVATAVELECLFVFMACNKPVFFWSSLNGNSWCGYMKGGLPERGPALPILMVISSSKCWKEGSSAFCLTTLDSGGRAKAMWGSAPTPCEWQKKTEGKGVKSQVVI